MRETQFDEVCRYKMPFHQQFIYLFIYLFIYSYLFFLLLLFFQFLFVSYFLLSIRLSFLPLFSYFIPVFICLRHLFIIASSHLCILHTFHSSGKLQE